jgi:uncharacterized protein (DUF885 family)
MNTAQTLADLAQRYWRFECHEIPLTAALAGEPTGDAVLFRESAADHARRNADAGALLAELQRVDRAALDAQDRATQALLERELSGLRAQYAVHAHLRPWLLPAGPDFTAMFWANSTAIANAADATLYVDRLATIPGYLRDVEANIEAGLALGCRYPRLVLAGAAANTRGMLATAPEASPWMGPFKRSPATAQPTVQAQALRASRVVRDALLPALQNWADFLEGLMDRGARETLTCIDGPAGEAYYRHFVRHFTTTELDPQAIHALGLDEVARIGREIEAVAAQAGFVGDVPGYRAHLSRDAQFIAPSSQALRERIESLCKRIDRRIPEFFGCIPRSTYGVESIPEALSARLPPAYAQPGPADGSAAGVLWISGLPSKAPSYLHPALAVHEAWPGHLMHIALMSEQRDLAAFRRHGAVKYTACVEGWALYCEQLGIEMGVYTTLHEHYGRLEMELWRALRLVVDTGIHARGWSRAQAVDTMAAHLSLSRETLEAEVDRYAALPAQALAYQIGGLKLRELRRRAESRLGSRFTHRAFHDAVTAAGAVSLPVLDDLVEHWLQRQEARHDAA